MTLKDSTRKEIAAAIVALGITFVSLFYIWFADLKCSILFGLFLSFILTALIVYAARVFAHVGIEDEYKRRLKN